MMFSETIGVMLLTREHYSQFTQRPIGDARRESQALLGLSAESRDAVNATVAEVEAAGDASTPTHRRTTDSCSAAASRIPMATSGKSCGWTPRRSLKKRRARSGRRKEMAPQVLGIARNATGNGASRNPPRQLSDVVKAKACNSPPIRPFKAS
jgi:hypothetical protein